MIKWLIDHQWKETFRATRFNSSTGVNIVLGIFIFIMMAYLLLLGFFIDEILKNVFPDQDPFTVFNSFLFYYLGMDILMRFFLQDVPVLSITPYLHLPIKKGKMIHFMLSKSLVSFFNYLPLLIFIPFAIKVAPGTVGSNGALYWFLGVCGMILFSNFLAIHIKRQLAGNAKVVLIFALLLLSLAAADYFQLLNISQFASATFSAIAGNPLLLLVILGMIGLAYYINYNFLKRNAYLEEIQIGRKKNEYKELNTSFLDRYGKIGHFIALEMKLILRNKRPKSIFYLSVAFLLYGLIFYTNDIYLEGFGFLIFVGIFITGIFLSNYGQLLLSWHSSFFDKILSSNISARDYLESKMWLFVASSAIAFVLSIPYIYFGWKVVIINLACCLFNIGVNSFTILYFGLKNPKKVDLSKGAAFNYEGISATQFILVLPFLLGPILLAVPFMLFDIPWVGVGLLATMGIVGFILKDYWLQLLEKRYNNRKYIIASGFRQV
ncbi:DUF5687 family protein [Fulvivirgaceae bacterium BMA10]|uniref:DUF5687 family protein n=1 Tax=Splendidivirga corallicola TaxID=3051826 RepID=A0ABT8KHD3_9BACT|nr:DUF5687 family protein [Fulvivirgaceae bacterium BMA10]